jgi:antitoxin VapB
MDIEPSSRRALLALLAEWEPMEADFPVIADLPAEPVEIEDNATDK